MLYSVLVSCFLVFCAALSAGDTLKPKSAQSATSTDTDDSSTDSNDASDADPSGTGEVGEDIIIQDDIDTNDDEGVSS